MHMLKSNDPSFMQFGEIYFSWVFPMQLKLGNFIKKLFVILQSLVEVLKLCCTTKEKAVKPQGHIKKLYLEKTNTIC